MVNIIDVWDAQDEIYTEAMRRDDTATCHAYLLKDKFTRELSVAFLVDRTSNKVGGLRLLFTAWVLLHQKI